MFRIRHNTTKKYVINVTEQFSNTRLTALFAVAYSSTSAQKTVKPAYKSAAVQ